MASALLAVGAIGGLGSLASGVIGSSRARRQARRTRRASQAAARVLRERGREQADLRRRQGRRLQGRQRALIGTSGLTRESFFDTLLDTAMREEEAALRIERNAILAGEDLIRRGDLASSQLILQGEQALLGGVTDFLTSGVSLGVGLTREPS